MFFELTFADNPELYPGRAIIINGLEGSSARSFPRPQKNLLLCLIVIRKTGESSQTSS